MAMTILTRSTAAALALVLAAALMPLEAAMARTAEPPYAVTETADAIELRSYEPMIVAEVKVPGDRSTAISAGFRILAAYIFGGNVSKASIDMTAPVSQQKSEKIAMTAPVTQQQDPQQADNEMWRVRFVMPEAATLATLPKPNDERVKLIAEPERRFAVIRFSGWSSVSNLTQHRDELIGFVKGRGLATAGLPVMAFYDPPWTLPFLRRNEIMLELAEQKAP